MQERASVAGAGRARAPGRRLWITCVCAVAGLFSLPQAGAADQARTYKVVIKGLRFVPETLTVKLGDTVVWVNQDPFPHTVTAAGAFDSRTMEAGKSWRYVAGRAGAYPYLCKLHSNMKGKLQVE